MLNNLCKLDGTIESSGIQLSITSPFPYARLDVLVRDNGEVAVRFVKDGAHGLRQATDAERDDQVRELSRILRIAADSLDLRCGGAS